jgi:hypothetical protein
MARTVGFIVFIVLVGSASASRRHARAQLAQAEGDLSRLNHQLSKDKHPGETTCVGDWEGTWTIGRRHGGHMSLHVELEMPNGRIHGSGSDRVGEFDFEGTVTDHTIDFRKQYRGKHAVHYSGTSDDRRKTFSGKWHVEGREHRQNHRFTLTPTVRCTELIDAQADAKIDQCNGQRYTWINGIDGTCREHFGPKSSWDIERQPYCQEALINCPG